MTTRHSKPIQETKMDTDSSRFLGQHSIPQNVHRKPENILPQALMGLLTQYPQLEEHVHPIKAAKTVCGYQIGPFVLVAKGYIYQGLVSVSRDVINRAKHRDLYILLWIKESNRYYYIKPNKIINGKWNLFNNQQMLNFSIRLMTNLENFDDDTMLRRFGLPHQERLG